MIICWVLSHKETQLCAQFIELNQLTTDTRKSVDGSMAKRHQIVWWHQKVSRWFDDTRKSPDGLMTESHQMVRWQKVCQLRKLLCLNIFINHCASHTDVRSIDHYDIDKNSMFRYILFRKIKYIIFFIICKFLFKIFIVWFEQRQFKAATFPKFQCLNISPLCPWRQWGPSKLLRRDDNTWCYQHRKVLFTPPRITQSHPIHVMHHGAISIWDGVFILGKICLEALYSHR